MYLLTGQENLNTDKTDPAVRKSLHTEEQTAKTPIVSEFPIQRFLPEHPPALPVFQPFSASLSPLRFIEREAILCGLVLTEPLPAFHRNSCSFFRFTAFYPHLSPSIISIISGGVSKSAHSDRIPDVR